MGFTGDIRTFDIFDLLAWVHGRRQSGTLVLTRRSTKKRFAFRDGALHGSSSNDPRETIGQALVRDGLISEEALFKALLKQEKDNRRLGQILMGERLLGEEQLMRTLRGNALTQVYDVFLWADGRFDFRDEEVQPLSAQDLDIDLRSVLEEGRQRRGGRGLPRGGGAMAPAAGALPLERGHVPRPGRPLGGRGPRPPAGPRARRAGQDVGLDQPPVTPTRVRDSTRPRRAVRRGTARRG